MRMSMKEFKRREGQIILLLMMTDMVMLMKEEKFGNMKMNMKITKVARKN
jgi:hypothetical protein